MKPISEALAGKVSSTKACQDVKKTKAAKSTQIQVGNVHVLIDEKYEW
jgi:hypothetical protein